jgi:hypothetical protein
MTDVLPTDLAQQVYQRRKAGATDQSVADWLAFIGYYVPSDEIAGIASRYEQALDAAPRRTAPRPLAT